MPAPSTPGEALASRLLADSGVSALVSTRVWPTKPSDLKAGLPYIVYYKTSGGDGVNLTGRNRLQQYGLRVDCYAQTEAQAEAVRVAVLAAVNGWIDPANGVKGCIPQGDADEQENDDATQVSGQTLSLWFVG